jgi:hypothetical protein
MKLICIDAGLGGHLSVIVRWPRGVGGGYKRYICLEEIVLFFKGI